MTVRVEFFGIARQRAGAVWVEVDAATLGDALHAAGQRYPRFAESCLDGDRLTAGYTASINGERFVTDPATPLEDGDAVLVLSADAGG